MLDQSILKNLFDRKLLNERDLSEMLMAKDCEPLKVLLEWLNTDREEP